MIKLSDSILICALLIMGVISSLGCGKDDKVTDPQNNPPVILSLTAVPDTIHVLHSTTVTVIAEDPDGDALNYNWFPRGSELTPVSGGGNTIVLNSCSCINEPTGIVVLSIVDDGRGGTAQDSLTVWILPESGP